MPVPFDLTDAGFRADPYPVYRRLRETDPVANLERPDGYSYWFLTRHADCVSVLRDPRMSVEKFPKELALEIDSAEGAANPLARMFISMMLFRDAPGHTRLRTLANKAFTPRVVAGMRPRIEERFEALLAPALARGCADWMAEIANVLPVLVIAELLGVPTEDHAQLKQWSDRAAVLLDGSVRAELLPEATAAVAELHRYMAALLAERRKEPADDLLTGLVRAQERDDTLSDDEILATAVLLLGAGHETTTHLLGNGLLALLRHPGELARLRADPELGRSAVDELLRFDAPVQATSRRPLEDLEIDGHAVTKDTEVVVCLGAANRDPAEFPDPDRLDLGRGASPLLSFGHGAHFCMGAPLARLEGEVVFAGLAARGVEVALDGALGWREGYLFRGLERLPVRFEEGA